MVSNQTGGGSRRKRRNNNVGPPTRASSLASKPAMRSESRYKDKSPASRIAAAWGYTRRAGVSSSLQAHWASRRGKKLLLGVFVLLLSLCIFFLHLIRLSAGLAARSFSSGGGSSSSSAAAAAAAGGGRGLDDPPLPEPEDVAADTGAIEELAPVDWAAKNIEDKWEQPVARRLHMTVADLEDEATKLPVKIPIQATLQGTNDLDLELCQFNMAHYHRSPEHWPMSHDLVWHFCTDRRRAHTLASELAKDESAGAHLQPTGFIFHESRVGSTLVANMLASVPTNLVYSEPHAPISVVRECELMGCSEDETVRLLRMAVLAMGRSHHHQHVFIKFQSSFVPYMPLLLKAFPDTPWVFIYRDPVEIMVSNFKGTNNGKMPKGPCLRTKKHPPAAIQAILGKDSERDASGVSNEEYCAAHLAMLCNHALEHIDEADSKGLAVPYESLVDDILDVVVPGHFGVALPPDERARMAEVSTLYSKSRQEPEDFEADAAAKQAAATEAVKAAADTYLHGPTERLHAAGKRARKLVEQRAALRAQEAHVYARTGSRFFQLPHCPDEPEYPPSVPIMDMVANWNPDDIAIPARHHSTLCRLDFTKDLAKALRYRDAEVPFVVHNIPELEETVRRWNEPGYLERKLGDEDKYHVEISKSNHFMYYRLGRRKRKQLNGYVPPTTSARWTYAHWLHEARQARNISAHEEHYYFRVSASDNDVVAEDVTIFKPERSLFMKEPQESRGIHCRFGMRGVLAEGHFDASRNMVALVSGTRRWILAHPRECKHSYLLPLGHPSGRHTQVDWSDPDLEKWPEFRHMRGHEVLLTPGEVLFVPAWWIHSIVNLDINIQCNSRSGDSAIGMEDLAACGFYMGRGG